MSIAKEGAIWGSVGKTVYIEIEHSVNKVLRFGVGSYQGFHKGDYGNSSYHPTNELFWLPPELL